LHFITPEFIALRRFCIAAIQDKMNDQSLCET